MHLLYQLLICVFALATLVQGAPKGKNNSTSEDKPGQKFRETPEYLCGHVYKGFYERYYLLGTEWPVHEYLVFEGVVKTPGCVMSNWRWQETTNPETNGYSFNCTVSLLRNVHSGETKILIGLLCSSTCHFSARRRHREV
jgi:hypothetical protein